MAILNEDVSTSQQGFAKEIDEKGKALLMDMAQRGQYSKPVESTVRETASNSVDSMRERDIAISILKGESTIEDHFVVKDGEIYEDSVFDASYYDLDWLSDTKEVKIQYVERDDEERDLLRFIDAGVGLGGKRLEGFFSLSYSTKRLNKQALGKFGIGAKAPLSMQIPSYKMISHYNGQRFEFDIFLRHIQSVTSRWNAKGEENQSYQLGSYEYYSEATEEKNGVTIELEVKKHLKSKVKDAIEQQLMYFKNIQFEILHNNWVENVNVETEVYFENEHFIISRNSLFTKPHLVLGQPGAQINYGLIDFQELEISPKVGNVGIKVNNEDVEITPSREDIIWSPQTRAVILKKFGLALETANQLVADELREDDILKWISKNISLNSTSGTNPILRQLSGLIDKTKLVATYNLDSSIFYGEPRKMFGSSPLLREISFSHVYRGGFQKSQVKRTEINKWNSITVEEPLYYTEGSANARKDAYIKSLGHSSYTFFTFVNKDDDWWLDKEATLITEFSFRLHIPENTTNPLDAVVTYPWSDEEKATGVNNELALLRLDYEKSITFFNYLKQSVLAHNYDLVQVPTDWVDDVASEAVANEDGNIIINTGHVTDYVDNAKRRKEEGKIYVKYPYYTAESNWLYNGLSFSWNGTEMDVADLNSIDGDLVYTTQTERIEDPNDLNQLILDPESGEKKMQMIASLLLGQLGIGTTPSQLDIDNNLENLNSPKNYYTYNLFPKDRLYSSNNRGTKDLIFVKVAKSLTKKLQNFTPIDRFMLDVDPNGVAFTHQKLMNWYTAKKVYEKIKDLEFLKNFAEISPYHAREFNDLYEGAKLEYFDRWGNLKNYPSDIKDKFVNDLEQLARFQQWIKVENPTSEEIGEYAMDNFSLMLTNAKVIDLSLLDRAQALVDWASPIVDLLNNITYFRIIKSETNKLSNKEEFLNSIRHYLRDKSVPIIELTDVQSPIDQLDSGIDDDKLEK